MSSRHRSSRASGNPDVVAARTSAHGGPRYVFLDTEVFVAARLNFDSSGLTRLRVLVESGRVELCVSTVVVDEVRKRLRKKAEEFTKAAENLLRLRPLFGERSACFKRLKVDLEGIDAEQCLFERFEEFLAHARVEVLPIEGLSMQTLWSWYDAGTAPFGTGAKRSEFPDAISMMALLEHANAQDRDIDVVSRDKDLERFCEAHARFTRFESLGALIDDDERSRAERGAALSSYLQLRGDELAAFIAAAWPRNHFEIDDPNFISAEVSDIQAVSVTELEVDILDADAEPATVSVDARVTFKARLEAEDTTNATYDREDGVYVNTTPVDHLFVFEITARFILTLSSSRQADGETLDFELVAAYPDPKTTTQWLSMDEAVPDE